MKKLLKALAIIAAPVAGLLAAATVTGSGLATALHTSTDSGGDHKVTICHHVEGNGNTGNGFNIISVDKDSIVNVEGVLNGHGLHELDIIPAFPAGNDGPHSWGSFPGQGDASLIGQNCGGEETTTSTTDTTDTSTTETIPTTTETVPPGTTTVPHGDSCPPGFTHGGGKDGQPGNDDCIPPPPEVPPSTSSTSQDTSPTTTTSQGTTETTSTTPSSPPPPGPVSKPKPKAKPKPKIVKIPGGSAAPGYVPKIVHGHAAITGSG